MELYRINFVNAITACKVVKETDKTYVYQWPNEKAKWTVRKKDVDAPKEDYTRVIGTSRENLIKAIIGSIDYQIRRHTVSLKRLQENKEHFQTIK